MTEPELRLVAKLIGETARRAYEMGIDDAKCGKTPDFKQFKIGKVEWLLLRRAFEKTKKKT